MEKLIPLVITDAEAHLKTDIKIKELLSKLGFSLSGKNRTLGAEFYKSKHSDKEVAIVSIMSCFREDYYRAWVDSDEKVVPGKNLRYLLDKDFKDWAASRGEWR